MDDLGVREVGLEDADNATTSVDHGKKFDSMVVLEFSTRVPPPAIQWILDKVKLSKRKGGSELMVCPVMDENREVCCLRPCMGSGVVRIDLLHFLVLQPRSPHGALMQRVHLPLSRLGLEHVE